MPVCSAELNIDAVSLLFRLLLGLGHFLFDGFDALDHAFHHLLFFLGALLDRLFGCLIARRLILLVAASRLCRKQSEKNDYSINVAHDFLHD
jgi:hypothetical protein